MIFLLTFLLIVLAVIICKKYKWNVTEPSFIFVVSFVMACIIASINANKWNLGLHLNTFFVILLGVLEFVLVCYVLKTILLKNNILTDGAENCGENIIINKWKKAFFICFIIIANIIYLYYIVKAVGGNFNGIGNILDAISKYDNISKFTEQFDAIKLPSIISNLRVAIIACGYWFIYVIVNNFIYQKRIDILNIIIVLLCSIMSCLSGTRTYIFYYIFIAIVFYLMKKIKKDGIKNTINKKFIKYIVIIAFVFLITFLPLAKLLGRNTNKNMIDYISTYCGAEIKNLDIFLQQENYEKENNIWGSQTFIYLIKTIGEKVGFTGYKSYQLDLPFQNINGYGLGNVYTTFYPYIYDFGYIGEFVLVCIMAIISQLSYEIANKVKANNKPRISILIYGLISCTLILSFFSNKFYEVIFSMNFIKYILVWIVCNYFFCNLDVRHTIKKFKSMAKIQ